MSARWMSDAERRAGVCVDTDERLAADAYSSRTRFSGAMRPDKDFATSCGKGCDAIKVDVSSRSCRQTTPRMAA